MKTVPICPKIRQFLFKAMHEVFKIGDFWSCIPAVSECCLCSTCGTTEMMSHILIHCCSRPTRLIWRLAKEAWPHTNIPWPETNLGTILGCGCLSVSQAIANPRQPPDQNPRSAHLRGASCLLKILISELAFLIWALYCERVIHEKNHTHQEIKSRWLNIINSRLTKDKIATSKIKRNKGFTTLVLNIWEKVLHKENNIPNNWINMHEVLVGSCQGRSLRQHAFKESQVQVLPKPPLS